MLESQYDTDLLKNAISCWLHDCYLLNYVCAGCGNHKGCNIETHTNIYSEHVIVYPDVPRFSTYRYEKSSMAVTQLILH